MAWEEIQRGGTPACPCASVGDDHISFNSACRDELGLIAGANVSVLVDRVNRAFALKLVHEKTGYCLQKSWGAKARHKSTARLCCARIQDDLKEFVGGVYEAENENGMIVFRKRIGERQRVTRAAEESHNVQSP